MSAAPDEPAYPRRPIRTRAATQKLYRERRAMRAWPTDVELSDELLDELVKQGHMTEHEALDPDARARALFFILQELVGL